LKKLKQRLLEGSFAFSPVRRIEVPKPGKKEKRPLGIPNFEDRIVQDAIRVVLNVIYEPVFQQYETNLGFRPERSTSDAIGKIGRERQGMTTAIEGDIVGAYNNVQYKRIMNILKKKIIDKKFLALIESGFKAGIEERGKFTEIEKGVRGIASPILFNIYMHEFDVWVIDYLSAYLKGKNKKEGRIDKAYSETYRKMKNKTDNFKVRQLQKYRKKQEDGKYWVSNILEYAKNKKILRKINSQKLKTKSIAQNRKLLRFSYTRYADDWIILTNANIETCNTIKKEVREFFKTDLHLEL